MTRQRILLGFAPLVIAAPLEAQRAGVDVTVHAAILMNGFRNSGRVNNADVPTVALPPDPAAASDVALGGAIRQTRIRIEARHEAVLGGALFAEVDADFFGGQQPSSGGRTHPVLRIRRGYGELRWKGGAVLVGQESPPLFGTSPVSTAASGLPLFASSGNLWLWLPQIRATGWLNPDGAVRIGIEGTVLAPSAGEPVDPFLTQPDRAEASGRPALEGRVVGRWRSGERDGEIGIGWHQGWLATGSGRVASRAFGAMVAAPLGGAAELRGELFAGRGLGGLGGGGIGQSLNADGEAIRTRGGFVQLLVRPVEPVELGAGFGIDDPDDDDLTGTSPRSRNRVWSAGVWWRPTPVVAGLEVRQIATRYGVTGPTTARAWQVNLGLGIEF